MERLRLGEGGMSLLARWLIVATFLGAMPVLHVALSGNAQACESASQSTSSVSGGDGLFVLHGTSAESTSSCAGSVATQPQAYLDILNPHCEVGGLAVCHETALCPEDGVLHETAWVHPDGTTTPGPMRCLYDGSTPVPTVTGAMVAEAFARIPLPTSTLGMNPPDGETLVNLPTIFHTRAEGFSRDVRLLGRSVHLEIRPVSFRWRVGQGGEFATDWGGKPYQRGLEPEEDPDAYVTWTYQDAGVTEKPSVTVVWGATYSVDGGPALTVPAQVPMTSPSASLAIREARPVLTGVS